MSSTDSSKSHRLWMIDDNIGDRILVEEALERIDLPIELTFFQSGSKAWETLESIDIKNWPHLILLDLNMPGLKGGSLLKRLKQHDSYRILPVIILSTSSLASDYYESYMNGANGVFTKPFGFDEHVNLLKSITNYWFTQPVQRDYYISALKDE